MIVSNKINKRINKDTIRMFFELENDKGVADQGELLVEVKFGFFTKANFKADVSSIPSKNFRYVYFDVKRKVFATGKAFSWIFINKSARTEGKGVLTDKWENLYEGN